MADFIADHFTENICYHNIDHTLEVVEAAELIGKKCDISDRELEIVITASWFHDTGYYLGCENHEEASAGIAKQFLKEQQKDQEFIDSVIHCILSTKVPQSPGSLLEKIICDADLYHLSTTKFFEKSHLLWQEFSYNDENITQQKWLKQSKKFVEEHRYHTRFGKEKLYPRLKKNLNQLETKINSSN